MKLPFEINITDKVYVVTGAGGVLCSMFAEALAKGYSRNVLDKESIEKANDETVKDFGTCDILINGAGGNNPKATTDNEYFTPEAMGNVKTKLPKFTF